MQPDVLVEATAHFTGSVGQQRVPESYLADLHIPLPPIEDQRRITSMITAHMADIERARACVQAQLQAARELPAALLRDVFDGLEAQLWPTYRLGDFVKVQSGYAFKSEWFTDKGIRLLRNANVFQGYISWTDAVRLPEERRREFMSYELSEGDIVLSLDRPLVSDGLKLARLAETDIPALLLQRVARFICSDAICSEYLFAFLNSSFFIRAITQHDQSIGVPHVAPKQVEAVPIPVPPLEMQQKVATSIGNSLKAAEQLRKRLQERLDAINEMPAALLREAFAGRLLRQEAVVIEIPERLFDRRGLLSAYIVEQLHAQPTFGRTQHMKLLNLIETHLEISLGYDYERQAAGPFDKAIYKLDNIARKEGWYTFHDRDGVERGDVQRIRYAPARKTGELAREADTLLGDKRTEMDRLLDLFATLDTEHAEMLTTLHAAWNDFLLAGIQPTDGDIIREVRENWHESKRRFDPETLQAELDLLRERRLVPRGVGPHTRPTGAE